MQTIRIRRKRYRIDVQRLLVNLFTTTAVLLAGIYAFGGFAGGEGRAAAASVTAPKTIVSAEREAPAPSAMPTPAAATRLSALVPERTPEPVPTSTPKPAPTATPKKAAKGLLVLVNWDNPTSGKRPEGLISLETAFAGASVSFTNAQGSVNAEAGAAAKRMLEAAAGEGVGPFKIASAYRSVGYQQGLWEQRLAADPSYGAEPFTTPVRVMPGNMSEHATGLALDILSVAHDLADDAFAETAEGRWLADNAHRYGFILRYPAGKQHITGVVFEPWHYRYVGVDDATAIYERGLCLEEYVE